MIFDSSVKQLMNTKSWNSKQKSISFPAFYFGFVSFLVLQIHIVCIKSKWHEMYANSKHSVKYLFLCWMTVLFRNFVHFASEKWLHHTAYIHIIHFIFPSTPSAKKNLNRNKINREKLWKWDSFIFKISSLCVYLLLGYNEQHRIYLIQLTLAIQLWTISHPISAMNCFHLTKPREITKKLQFRNVRQNAFHRIFLLDLEMRGSVYYQSYGVRRSQMCSTKAFAYKNISVIHNLIAK